MKLTINTYINQRRFLFVSHFVSHAKYLQLQIWETSQLKCQIAFKDVLKCRYACLKISSHLCKLDFFEQGEREHSEFCPLRSSA